ncbi:hypothetical protein M9H77_35461 [Catharanthus roseus]|uniref:Uncharacterized protein n=1 Tax=Catharanthus roseus TaxID=4058 RepID=A0ACB9ZQD5_CATRO|nr:hypothetical protein M9H77_35461 [Catharanthus roseus]
MSQNLIPLLKALQVSAEALPPMRIPTTEFSSGIHMIKECQFLKDRVQGSSFSGYSYSPMLAAPQIDSDFVAHFSKDNLVRSSIGLHVGLPQPPIISGGLIHATLGVTGKGVICPCLCPCSCRPEKHQGFCGRASSYFSIGLIYHVSRGDIAAALTNFWDIPSWTTRSKKNSDLCSYAYDNSIGVLLSGS